MLYASVAAAQSRISPKKVALVFIGASFVLIAVSLADVENRLSAWLIGAGLLSIATALGSALGAEIQERRHIWPLIIVAVCFDLWSVTAPDGVSQNLVSDEGSSTVLSFLALSLPVPGLGIQPILGLGDVVYSSFLMGATNRLGLSSRVAIIGQCLGYALRLAILLIIALPIPALAFVAPVYGLAMGRQIRPHPLEVLGAFAFVGIAFVVKNLLF